MNQWLSIGVEVDVVYEDVNSYMQEREDQWDSMYEFFKGSQWPMWVTTPPCEPMKLTRIEGTFRVEAEKQEEPKQDIMSLTRRFIG